VLRSALLIVVFNELMCKWLSFNCRTIFLFADLLIHLCILEMCGNGFQQSHSMGLQVIPVPTEVVSYSHSQFCVLFTFPFPFPLGIPFPCTFLVYSFECKCDSELASVVLGCNFLDCGWLNVLILKMYEINTLLLLPLKIYLIILKHIKSFIY